MSDPSALDCGVGIVGAPDRPEDFRGVEKGGRAAEGVPKEAAGVFETQRGSRLARWSERGPILAASFPPLRG